MACILLTGGAGYIGSHTYLALVDAGHEVVILDNFENAKRSVIDRLSQITQRPVSFVEGDVLKPDHLREIFKSYAFDGVIHFAGKKAVGESSAQPLSYVQTNVAGTLNTLHAMKEAGVSVFVFSSTATVYGEPEIIPIPEDCPLGFTNPYSFTKFTVEHLLSAMRQAEDAWRFGVLRYFNPAGAHASGMIGEDPRDIPNNLMPYIAKVALGELPKLQVFGDDYETHDGTGVRDYIHVSDLARAHVLSLEALIEGRSHVVNIGTGIGYSVLEMLAAYRRASGKSIAYEITDRRPGDVATLVAKVDLARELLGFEAQRGLDEMCRDSWRWIGTQQD